jgi:hypothetical protein
MPADKTTADPGLPRDRPTEAYWQCPPHAIASHQSPKLASEASVVIIGSGITGASVAHHLLKACPALDIVMLEARTICSGATGRNGGHCKDVSFKTYSKLKAQLGRQAAMQLVKFRRSHVDAARQLAHQLSEEGFSDGQFREVTSHILTWYIRPEEPYVPSMSFIALMAMLRTSFPRLGTKLYP